MFCGVHLRGAKERKGEKGRERRREEGTKKGETGGGEVKGSDNGCSGSMCMK